MKIALIGYGKMGRAVEEIALKRGHMVTFDIEDAEVAIDFSAPEAVHATAFKIAAHPIPWVIGTTGWNHEEVLSLARKENIPVVYGSNFSLGMALFIRLAKKADQLLSKEYEKGGIEIHHEMKKDAPSGTALTLEKNIPGLKFSSVRSGFHVGAHHLLFDSPEDTIELIHRAKSRMGFAKGAVLAAEWLEKRVGIFTFDDFVEEIFRCELQEPLPL